MSYATGEAQILTLIQGVAGDVWTADNSISLANDEKRVGDTLLNSGKSYHYVLLRPGPFDTQDGYLNIGFTRVLYRWQTVITLYVLAASNRSPMKVLADDRQGIIDRLVKYERLSNLSGVRHAELIRGGEIVSERIGGGPRRERKLFFRQELFWRWDEEADVSQQD